MAQLLSARDVWLKTHITQEGDTLTAKTFMVAAGNPHVFTVSINLAKVEAYLASYHKRLEDELHAAGEDCVGCGPALRISGLGSLSKLAKKVGRSKLLKSVNKTAKKAVRSKAVGATLTVSAAVYPPVGAPALGAYVAANQALDAIERANAVKGHAKAAVKTLKGGAKVRVKLTRKSRGSSRFLSASAKARLKAALRKKAAAKKTVRVIRARAPEVKAVLERGAKAKAVLAKIAETARYSPNRSKQLEAQKTARVIALVAAERAKRAAITRSMGSAKQAGETGLVVTSKGRIVPGRFVSELVSKSARPEMLIPDAGNTVKPGYYTQVGGCIGCDCVGCI